MKEIKRWQESDILEGLKERRVVVLEGARQVGKTTLAKLISKHWDATYRTLDDEKLLDLAKSDARSFLLHDKQLMIIDEIQKAPNLIPAIKMVVDENHSCGQFLLTGSANIQTLPTVRESLAGRVCHIRLCPLTQGEILGKVPTFFDRLSRWNFKANWEEMSRRKLLEIAFRGGFPEAINKPLAKRRRWHIDYVRALVEHDLVKLVNIRKHDVLSKLLNIFASWSSKPLNFSEIASSLETSSTTLREYALLLQMMYIVDFVPPWANTDCGRARKKDKFFMADPGLMASLLRWNVEQTYLNSEHVGKLVETLVFNELKAQIFATGNEYAIYHYRDHDQREIDFILERYDGELIAIEVKAGSNICQDDFKHLKWFRENIAKKRPFQGIVLYNGTLAYQMGGLKAVPIGALWE